MARRVPVYGTRQVFTGWRTETRRVPRMVERTVLAGWDFVEKRVPKYDWVEVQDGWTTETVRIPRVVRKQMQVGTEARWVLERVPQQPHLEFNLQGSNPPVVGQTDPDPPAEGPVLENVPGFFSDPIGCLQATLINAGRKNEVAREVITATLAPAVDPLKSLADPAIHPITGRIHGFLMDPRPQSDAGPQQMAGTQQVQGPNSPDMDAAGAQEGQEDGQWLISGYRVEGSLMVLLVGIDANIDFAFDLRGFGDPEIPVGRIRIAGGIQTGFGIGGSANIGPLFTRDMSSLEDLDLVVNHGGATFSDDVVLYPLGFEADYGWADNSPARTGYIGIMGGAEEVSVWYGRELLELFSWEIYSPFSNPTQSEE